MKNENHEWCINQLFISNKADSYNRKIFKIREIELDDVTGNVMYLSSCIEKDSNELHVFREEEMHPLLEKASELPDLMLAKGCEKCGSADCCERTDLVGDPVLCDECYKKEIYSDCDCDACLNSFYEGDKMRCKVDKCTPHYEL